MNYNINKSILGIVVLVLFITPCVISQNNDTIVFKQNDSIPVGYWCVKKKSRVFSSKIYLTQNGISPALIFTIDKPALIIKSSIGGRRLTFDPDIRFSLDGKPWGFLFWVRYKIIDKNKYKMKFGTHPGFAFTTVPVVINNVAEDILLCKRYIAGDHTQSYQISEKLSVGTYYFYTHCLDGLPDNLHFAAITTSIRNINLFSDINLSLSPSIYYLRMDGLDGVYFTSTIQLKKDKFPLSFHSIINKKISSEVLPERKFLWNISLVYSFKKPYFESPVGI